MIVDSHVHAGEFPRHYPEPFAAEMMGSIGGPPDSIATHIPTLLREMDAAQIDKAVLLAFDAQRTLGVKVPNEYIAELCRAYPDRFIGFCSVDAGVPGAAGVVHTSVETMGLRGVKIAPAYVGLSPADRCWYPVYEAAEALKVPVLAHTGFTPARSAARQYMAPGLVAQIATDFPQLRLILAHLGAPWVTQCLELLARHPNLYADLSIFGWYQPIATVAGVLAQARAHGLLDRLIWGTDHPWCPIVKFRARMEQLAQDAALWPDNQPLTRSEWSNLMGGTALRLVETS